MVSSSTTGLLFVLSWLVYVRATCQSFYTDFTTLDGFTPLGKPEQYALTDEGLKLYMRKPRGAVHFDANKGVNDILGTGCTLNSTFEVTYGKVSFNISAPRISGLVTAGIMLSADDSGDEIDVEILGGDPTHWQTNVYAPPYPGAPPAYGKASSVERIYNIADYHTYTVDWNEDRIKWGVNGKVVRTLLKKDTYQKRMYTYPTHAMRIQLGIWDSSGAKGTAHWAKGPVNWTTTPDRVEAVIRSVQLDCEET